MTDPEIHKGLAGVVVDVTAISKVNPETNSLLYRGYPVQQLCEKCTFEEVAYLLWHGELPNPDQLEEFQKLERSLRPLDARTKRVIDELPLTAHPMDVVRTAVSVIGATDSALAATTLAGADGLAATRCGLTGGFGRIQKNVTNAPRMKRFAIATITFFLAWSV